MATDEEQIRTLIERWAEAVHAGDLDGVLAGHADDIVMYDVPPPYEGVRGIDAYRKSWPGFFQWQAQGGSFEIETLDVTAGADVAFAHALLRCGTPEELAADPGYRLRLTLGLRKEDGRWVVAHEHHSFPITDRGAAEEEVRRVHQRWYDGTAAKDLDGMMAAIAGDVVSYEHEAPLQYVGVDAVREVCARGLGVEGAVSLDVPGLKILVREDLAVAWGLNHVRVVRADGQESGTWSRGTRVFERRDGAWMMVHQHLSFPMDLDTGAARTDLSPSR
ncbi:YybH family protein [Nonomuraea basaltis]|uniref:YybH family protein n=1 Tax=Nonomuraea basaltis TaxID=2495887 RepID=UPI00110C54BD|nr:SgcJ/EcaC family oxidoreductase [Nonomuraea basaltis]TMR93220.1 SgcJ/EcaC family oxidoreductase [Nonomuraea basaltis]